MVVELSLRQAILAVSQVVGSAVSIGIYYGAVMTHPFPEWLPVKFAFWAVTAGAVVVAVVLALFCDWLWVAVGALLGLLSAATRLQFHATAAPAGVFHAAAAAVAGWHRLLAAIVASVTIASWVTVRLRIARARQAGRVA